MLMLAARPGAGRGLAATSTRLRVAASFLALALLVVGLVGLLAGRAARHEVERGIGERLHELATSLADRLEGDLAEREREIGNLVVVAQGQALGLDAQAWRPVVEQLQRSFPHYAWIGLADVDGRVRAASGGLLEGRNVSQRPWFAQALQGAFLGDVHEAKLLASLLPPQPDGEPIRLLDVAAPLHAADGRVEGVLGAHLSLRWAEEQRARLLRPELTERGVEVLVFDRSGRLLLGPAGRESLRLPAAAGSLLSSHRYAVLDWLGADGLGEPMLTAAAEVRGRRSDDALGWQVVLRQPLDRALAPARELQRRIWLVGGAGAAAFAGLGWWLAGWLTAPLVRLVQRAREALDAPVRGPQARPDALPPLRSPAAPDRPDGTADDEAGAPLEPAAAEAGAQAGDRPDALLAGGAVAGGADLRQLDASLAELVRRLRGREAELLALNASLEARVAQRTAALEQALRELRGFSRMVAHDLRGPLSAVAQLLQLARGEAQRAGIDEAARLADIGARECQRLGNLVQELLQLAQVDQQPLQRTQVDMQALVQQVWQALADAERQAGRRVPALHLQPLPAVPGDAVLLRQVWTNLLANAIKFSAKADDAQVWVQAEAARLDPMPAAEGPAPVPARVPAPLPASAGPATAPVPPAPSTAATAATAAPASPASSTTPVPAWTFSVRDNGAGFDMAQAARLFTAFERLHRQSDFPGTGLGLSIVQRIVERHGGRVAAEGAPGQGACMRFTLPAQEAAAAAAGLGDAEDAAG